MNIRTDGKTVGRLCRFALPIVAGGFLQQFYTAVDALLVGHAVGNEGLAAIGVSGALISFFVFIVFGAGIGTTVLLSQYSAEGQQAHYRRVAVTSLTSGLLISVAIASFCLLFARPILSAFGAHPAILNDSMLYLRIMSVGLPFSFLYNFYNALLLSIGDARTPFFALLAATLTNIATTWLLTAVFKLGVAGAAAGSVCSQGVSFLYCYIRICNSRPALRFRVRELSIDRAALVESFRYSGATAIQKLLMHGGKVLVQGAVNLLAVNVIAGYSVAVQIENFILSAMDGVGIAMSRYCAQCVGRNDLEGAKRTFLAGMCLSLLTACVIASGIYWLSPAAVGLFVKRGAESELASGVAYLRAMSGCYLVLGFSDTLLSLLRSLGRMNRTILATVMQMTFRVGLTYLLIRRTGLMAICYGTLAGWIVISVFNGRFAWRWLKQNEPLFADTPEG